MIRSFTLFGSIAMILAGVALSDAHSPPLGALSADEIIQTLKGKICTTSAGAKFKFGEDWQYSYEGLWKNTGRYSVNAGAITVIFDNGLERSFVISRKGDVFYMEETAISCGQ
jgi:hypothetical protein